MIHILHHIISYYIILYHMILYYIMSYYIILYYTLLYHMPVHTCHILPSSEIDLGLCLAVFAGSGGKYLFHRIG